MKIFITGATGLIGTRLTRALLERGDHVVALSRRPRSDRSNITYLVGDPAIAGSWLDELSRCEAVVHLAGEPIFARRWSPSFLEELRASRVNSTRLIAGHIPAGRPWICGSAIGIYGADLSDTIHNESSPPGTDTLARIGVEWEAAAAGTAARLVLVRTGIVLDPLGGALPRMAKPFRLFLGGRVASGRQYLSWIHHEDMTRLLLFSLDTPGLAGPVNATAPAPVTNADFCRVLGRVLRRPCWLPVPGLALRLVLGRVAEVVTRGQRVEPRELQRAGFEFRFPDLESALRNIYEQPEIPASATL